MTDSLVALSLRLGWGVQIEPLRVRWGPARSREVHSEWTQYTAECPHGSVTESMKELAGQTGYLVDSYERRPR
ncbi:hypothetical protein GCM10009601_23090 [Streptomyces thermospinosisporus]|uniref:Uncharacterized protein n=1 Tax=Streptomyces thermospinosisporus TaxID=161482 RepID=A0ABN1YTQ1_9ACTN